MSEIADSGFAGIAAALVKAQGQIESASKNRENPHFRSKYADFASVCDACRAPFANNGLAFTQDPVTTEKTVSVSTTLWHVSGQRIVFSPIVLPVTQSTPQAFGSALTYARRFSLQTAVGIAAEEDDDGNAASKAGPQVKPAAAKRAAPPSAPPVATQAANGEPVVGFGKYANRALSSLNDAELAWYISNASKEADKAKNEADRLAWVDRGISYTAELARRGPQAEAVK